MAKKVLVCYASQYGSTAGVAEAIAEVIGQQGADVVLKRAREVKPGDLDDLSGVVIGTTIRAGTPAREVARFLDRNRVALADLPVAYFTVGLTMRDNTEAARAETLGYLKNLRAIKEPVATGLFAGALDVAKLSAPMRALMSWAFKQRGAVLESGDWRDWDAIRAWAKDVAPKLLSS